MPKTPLLGTGLNGLVGSKFVELFKNSYSLVVLDISDPNDPVDITQYDQVAKKFETSSAQFVLHFAAFTDVTAAWEQRGDKQGLAYKVNVDGTANVVKAAQSTCKHVIHVSTAYVFNGEKAGLYHESEPMDPIEWYGQTKAWAEEKVQSANCPWTILRIDQPFRSDAFAKTDVAHRIASKLKDNSLYPMFTDHFFGPTVIEEFSRVIDWVIRTSTTGLFHASSGEQWSDFEFANLIKQKLELPGEVKSGSLSEYLKTLNRPYQKNTALDTSKLTQALDFQLQSIDTAIGQLEL